VTDQGSVRPDHRGGREALSPKDDHIATNKKLNIIDCRGACARDIWHRYTVAAIQDTI